MYGNTYLLQLGEFHFKSRLYCFSLLQLHARVYNLPNDCAVESVELL
jgi:hypothetical protein